MIHTIKMSQTGFEQVVDVNGNRETKLILNRETQI